MKKLVLLILISHMVKAQVSIESMIGNSTYLYQQVISKEIKNRIGFFNTSSMYVSYHSQKPELMTQSYITYNLNSHFRISAGSFYASLPGFTPSIQLQYRFRSKNLLMLLAQRADVSRRRADEFFAALEFTPRLRSDLKLYSRLQAMYSYTKFSHNRSYQLIRLGVELKKIQFGLAANLDAYGREQLLRSFYGVFIRKALPLDN